MKQHSGLFFHLPTVDHNGPSVLGVAILHFFEELEHANRSEGHSEVWPAGEMELGDEPLWFLPRHVSHLRGSSTRFRVSHRADDRAFILLAASCNWSLVPKTPYSNSFSDL